jgi:hypothetical protein
MKKVVSPGAGKVVKTMYKTYEELVADVKIFSGVVMPDYSLLLT